MNELRKLQESLQAYLLTHNESVKQWVSEPTRGKSNERLAIYADAYRLRLIEVLSKEYTVLQRYLGTDQFTQLAQDYLTAYPSEYFSIDEFGQHLACFLANTAPYQQQPHLSEFADFLWQLSGTVIAPDAPLLTKEKVQQIPQENWPQLCFKVQPSLRILVLRWNILAIWQALEKRSKPPKPALEKSSVYCVIWRKKLQPFYMTLQPDAAWMLTAIQNGHTFAEVCEGLLQWHTEENAAQQAVNYLLQWLNEDILSDVYLREHPA